ncbi:hypothetical protein CAL29_08470 [Bordetella genomosp. 10]|uniref:DUF1127 domain-containing protein n=1 Tax=Bordetella genomosp. 10 TaxID=1416804 RepID=A0A261SMZ0_9BORD|nr:hypothetical protein CAL29_08470 [Bordetella genomosp. 10]
MSQEPYPAPAEARDVPDAAQPMPAAPPVQPAKAAQGGVARILRWLASWRRPRRGEAGASLSGHMMRDIGMPHDVADRLQAERELGQARDPDPWRW